MNAIYRLLDLPDGPIILFGLIILVFSLVALNIYLAGEMKKRIQQKTDTFNIWFSYICACLIQLMFVFNITYHLYHILK